MRLPARIPSHDRCLPPLDGAQVDADVRLWRSGPGLPVQHCEEGSEPPGWRSASSRRRRWPRPIDLPG